MNFLKKGPELKLSELKVPVFIQDIYFDLKDRHLLPVAAVLLVAIIAVPIAVSQSGSDRPEAGETSVPGAAGGAAPTQAAQLVAKSTPGLRDYRRRLKRLRAKDPFVQQYTGSENQEGAGESSSEVETEGSFTPTESSPEPSSPATPSPESEPKGEPSPTYFSYAIDISVSAGGSSDKSEKPSVRRNLPELTMLPSRKTPALVYMGSTRDGKKALMLVSSDVDAIFGDAKCVLGSETCELLAMQPGLPETIVFGGAERTYRVELRKIHLVRTKELNRAPLGQPKQPGTKPQPDPHGGSG